MIERLTLYSNRVRQAAITNEIIEVVSGMGYEAFVRQRLLDPLGMPDTVLRPDDLVIVSGTHHDIARFSELE